ncbi:ubiquitin carboxyl-terminal hydrolase MINDY-3-like [Telopea speciosissima]|uniref:ubiquitin carboxyl-terminal hydrolase MINDY-3-like n=1 Tax=Telopea speciosissima TaxID=54955 RepID=UPI001CC3B183|nr:ubiquitin carboxyl-terminal hydrolase MINDY-3-like [Telopea speciosissima]
MGDQEEEELRMALHMSMQNSPPEAKRSKPRENVGSTTVSATLEESPEAKNRKLQRELMAAAAEKRMTMAKNLAAAKTQTSFTVAAPDKGVSVIKAEKDVVTRPIIQKAEDLREELSPEVANQLFSMVFGSSVSRDILAQWTNQGIRFSADPETCMGLVQHEGGPCGVLATIQAFVLKYLLFCPDEIGKHSPNLPQQNLGSRSFFQSDSVTLDNLSSLTEDGKTRALVQSMVEILFLCGSKKQAIIATLSILGQPTEEGSEYGEKDEIIAKALEGLSIESASDVQKVLRVNTYTSRMSAFHSLQRMLPVFQSRMGAMLFLISALLSRGLESVQADRDDPSLPLVTAPFGHASQEIVNLLLCGQAVPNVFDGRMDLGGGMFLKGIPTSVDVGFLSLLESFNFCKVGQHLKRPKWPIWVVGSESHYTVLFAFNTHVQDENELEERESQIRRAFDAQDQSGGGGFISVEGLHQVLREININLPPEKVDHLCSSGFIVWSEFWQVLLELDKSLGGMKDSSGLMGKKLFDLYHFNGIAKSVLNGNQATSGSVISMQRPRLSKLRVSVPPRWTPEEFMADVGMSSNTGSQDPTGKDMVVEVTRPEPTQHAPLVDCIRTRWPRAVCNWDGDPPSIV